MSDIYDNDPAYDDTEYECPYCGSWDVTPLDEHYVECENCLNQGDKEEFTPKTAASPYDYETGLGGEVDGLSCPKCKEDLASDDVGNLYCPACGWDDDEDEFGYDETPGKPHLTLIPGGKTGAHGWVDATWGDSGLPSGRYTCPNCHSNDVDDDWPQNANFPEGRVICEDCNYEGTPEEFLHPDNLISTEDDSEEGYVPSYHDKLWADSKVAYLGTCPKCGKNTLHSTMSEVLGVPTGIKCSNCDYSASANQVGLPPNVPHTAAPVGEFGSTEPVYCAQCGSSHVEPDGVCEFCGWDNNQDANRSWYDDANPPADARSEDVDAMLQDFGGGVAQSSTDNPTMLCPNCNHELEIVDPDAPTWCPDCGWKGDPNELVYDSTNRPFQWGDKQAHNFRGSKSDLSAQEQQELVNEQGTARNYDKLNLKGTHYTTSEKEELDEHFLW